MMKETQTKVHISDIFLDESIYPRENIDHKRFGIFVENLRDVFVFEPIVVQVCPDPGVSGKKSDIAYWMVHTGGRLIKRLGVPQQTISRYLPRMPDMTKLVNTDLSKGFSVPQVAQKHDWPEPMVWSQALVNKDDLSRFKALQWGLRTWDLSYFTD